MFEDSLIESAGVLKTKRPAATVVSLLLQSALVAALAALPLLYTEALPKVSLTSLIAPGPPPPAPAPAAAEVEHRAAPRQSDLIGQRLREPQAIPRSIARIEESEVPVPAVPAGGPGVPAGTGDPSAANPLNAIVNLTPPAPVPHPTVSAPLRISEGVAQGFLVHQVKPVYPPLARQARIQGTVLLQAIIGKDGSIENLRLVSGHPMLAPAAIEAVRQWRYRPYTLNHAPVDVQTEITVNFVLGGG
ncbi:MAG TPA: TonB family protein [Terriglobales bacterium]|nr:TonB family protein [Terriglobales bacterium]